MTIYIDGQSIGSYTFGLSNQIDHDTDGIVLVKIYMVTIEIFGGFIKNVYIMIKYYHTQ